MKTTLAQIISSLQRAARPGGRHSNFGSEPAAKPKWHRARSVAAWAGVLFLLLCGSFTEARAQTVISDPNQITGTIGWNNSLGSPVFNFLNSSAPPHGLLYQGNLAATLVDGSFSASTILADDPGHLSVAYSITVQAAIAPGIQYDLTAIMTLEDGNQYYFAKTSASSGVTPEPDPDVTLNISECAGLINLQFVDAADNPVTVQSGQFSAFVQPSGSRQAYSDFGSISSKHIAVRGGNTFDVAVTIQQTSGSDFFFDYFSSSYTTSYTVTVGCDEIVIVKFIVPPSPIGSGGNAGIVGQIIGNVDMLGENEQWFDRVRTLMFADDGPFGNYRYDSVEPSVLNGPSEGPFSLVNLLPSNFSNPPRDYLVGGKMSFGLGRRFEEFTTPFLDGPGGPLNPGGNGRVAVPPNTTVELGNTFVIDPGYVVGDIFLCGPDEGANANSMLRHIYRYDQDGNGDGLPDVSGAYFYGTWVVAGGLNILGAGATKTAWRGYARALFEGDFVSSGPNQNHWIGDYRLALGGLLQETTHWDATGLALFFNNNATPADRDTVIYSWMAIVKQSSTDVEIVPTQTITKDLRYGLSQVIIRFNATSGTLFQPFIGGNGVFDSTVDGPNFENQSADYLVSQLAAHGTPTTLATATSTGQVVLCIPEGRYTFNPSVYSVNPDGISYSFNTLPPLNVTVGPCEFVELTPGLVLNVNTIPECVAQSELTLSGSVSSGSASSTADVASITYTLNGTTVTVCNNCGVNPSFNFTITLADCDNVLKITATDVNGLVSSRTKTIRFDNTPPVITGCQDISATTDAGTSGAVVNYAVTALDNCDSLVAVNCVPPPGSFFPIGETHVTCATADECGNTSTCTFTVTVTGVDTTPPMIHCPGNIITATDPGQCSAVVTFTATASDNVPGVTFFCSPPSGSAFPKGTTTVICTATDAAGNTANCSFTVTVNDSVPAALVFFGEDINSTATGNNEDAIRILHPISDTARASFLNLLTGVSSETFEAFTPNSGVSTLMFGPDTATISPSLTVLNIPTGNFGGVYPISGNQTLLQSSGGVNTFQIDFTSPQAAFGFYTTDVEIPGNLTLRFLLADGVTFIDRVVPTQATGLPPTPNNTGSVAYYGVIDAANPFIRVTFNRPLNPDDGFGFDNLTIGRPEQVVPAFTLACPAPITVACDPGQCAAVVNFAATASDHCPGVTISYSHAPGSAFPKGTTTVTATATDASGNTASCTFNVTVNDTEKPAIVCPVNVVASTDPGQCATIVNFAATATDNCPGVTISYSHAPGSAIPKGTTTVTATATDASGNTASCTFTVTVNDTEKPIAECVPTTNPNGKQIPTAGANPKSGQNPDGFYQLLATDNCDAGAGLQIFVKDSAEGPCGGAFMAGPYAPGTKVKLTQSPGHSQVKPMAGEIAAHINTRGEPVLVVTDSAGNTTCHKCFVPPLPK